MSISTSVLKIFYNVHIPSNVAEIAALGRNFAYKQCNMSESNIFSIIKNLESCLNTSHLNANYKHKIRQDIVKAIIFQTNCKQQPNL